MHVYWNSLAMNIKPAQALPVLPDAALKPTPAAHGWPVLRLGFRPFYLGAAAFAVLAVPLWVAMFLGHSSLPVALPPLLWHAHEMLFGFAAAVIVGFLLTAGKAWTGLATPRGGYLGVLVTLWLAARIAAVTTPYVVYAVLDALLLPVVAALLGIVLVRARSHRNLPLVALLVLLSVANLGFHLAVVGVIELPAMSALHAGLALIVMIQCVIAGRVVPAFTMSATPGLRLVPRPGLEVATLSVTAVALLLWIFAPPGPAPAVAFALAAVLHGVRQVHWHPWVSRTRPILWVLHASYAWIAMGFVLLAMAQVGWVGASAGVHALAVGATGGLIVGMMTRTARGHTGRQLRVSRMEVLAYALIMFAAAFRVFVPMAMPHWTAPALILSAMAWCGAFGIYLVVYGPWLVSARLDGRDG
jgi:uncharacterized protein involved in response to NO